MAKTPDEVDYTKQIFAAKPGECLFDRVFKPMFNEDDLPELLKKTSGLADDRLTAIVAALVVENRINSLLSAFLPKFNLIKDNIDISASMRSTFLDALNFVPTVLIRAADCIRSVRNKFAHHMEYTSFDDLPNQKDSTWLRIQAFHKNEFNDTPLDQEIKRQTRAEIFHQVYFYCIAGLTKYQPSIAMLRDEVSKPEVIDSIWQALSRKDREFWSALMRETPLEVIHEPAKVTTRYANDITITVHNATHDPEKEMAAPSDATPAPSSELPDALAPE